MKKYVASFLGLILVFSLLTSCGKAEQTPKERVAEAVEQSQDYKTLKQNFEMSMNLEMDNPTNDPELDMFLAMLQNVMLSGEIQLDQENMNFSGTAKVDLQGMVYETELYFTPEKYIVKVPIIGQYMTIYDLTEDNEQAEEINNYLGNTDEFKALAKEMNDKMLDLFSDDVIVALDDTTVTLPNGDMTVTPIEIKLNDAQVKDLIKEVFLMMFDNEQMRTTLINQMKMQSEMIGEELTEEEIEADFAETRASIEESMNMLDDLVVFDAFNIVYYLDDNNNALRSEIDIDVTVKENVEFEIPTDVKFGFNITTDIWDINEAIDITFPVLTDENSFSMEDMFTEDMITEDMQY